MANRMAAASHARASASGGRGSAICAGGVLELGQASHFAINSLTRSEKSWPVPISLRLAS